MLCIPPSALSAYPGLCCTHQQGSSLESNKLSWSSNKSPWSPNKSCAGISMGLAEEVRAPLAAIKSGRQQLEPAWTLLTCQSLRHHHYSLHHSFLSLALIGADIILPWQAYSMGWCFASFLIGDSCESMALKRQRCFSSVASLPAFIQNKRGIRSAA